MYLMRISLDENRFRLHMFLLVTTVVLVALQSAGILPHLLTIHNRVQRAHSQHHLRNESQFIKITRTRMAAT
jgi:hypothetical protein